TQLDLLYPIKGYWRRMFTIYLDDVVGHGRSMEQAEGRRRILLCALRALKKPISPKEPCEVKDSVDCLGLTLSAQGWSLSPTNVKKVTVALNITPKSSKQLRSIIGVYNYGVTAFQFDDANTFSSLMAPLHVAVNTTPFKWTEECREAQQQLLNHFENSPRAYLAYEDIMSLDGDKNSLCITTDASLLGTGAHLWYVKKPAVEVAIADLQQAGRSQLISSHSSLLDQSQQRWHVFEKECYAIFQALSKWRALIISVTRFSSESQPPSVTLFSDSTVAISKFLNDPDDDLFTGKTAIKARRFRAWQMELAEFDFIPIRRCADRLEAISIGRKEVNEETQDILFPMAPIMPIVEDDADEQDELPDLPPLGLNPQDKVSLSLSTSQAEIITQAYAEDDSTYLSIRVKAIWAVAMNIEKMEKFNDLQPAEITKAKAWISAGKFLVSPITEDPPTMGLYTQSVNRGQDLRKLPWVLTIPDNAVFLHEARMTTAYDPAQQLQSARQGLLLS
ncbi:hypothetical protein FOL47_002989, partial [Perkinsus chesapeaki]